MSALIYTSNQLALASFCVGAVGVAAVTPVLEKLRTSKHDLENMQPRRT